MLPLLSRTALTVASASGLLLLLRPYAGLEHDARLYFGQVLRHVGSPALAQDLFFAGGSQDAFSIYSVLVAQLYALLGVAHTHQGLVLLSLFASTAAVWGLLRRLGLGQAAGWGLVALAVLSPIYGGGRVFGILEPFLTARSFAEPLLVFGLWALLTGRLGLAAALQMLGAAFHPLMALPMLAVSWGVLVQGDRRWGWALLVLPLAGALAAAGVPPFDRLFKIYDPYWWALVTQAPQLVLANWSLSDWLTIATDVALLATARRLLADTAARRLLRALLACTMVLLAVSALGIDLLRSQLITQLQLWRVLWLTHLFALVLSPWLIGQLWRRGGFWRVSAAAAGLAVVSSHVSGDHGLAALAAWGLSSLVAWRGWPVSRSVIGLAVGAIAVLALGLSLLDVWTELGRLRWRPLAELRAWQIALALGTPVVAGAAFGALALAERRLLPSRWQLAPLLVPVVLLAFATWHWDRRSDLARAVEAARDAPLPRLFASLIPAQATVYWYDHLEATWGLLDRASHHARAQGAGLLFNRDTALLIGPRREAYRRIASERETCEIGAVLAKRPSDYARCDTPSVARLADLCAQTDRPDFLVFESRLPVDALAVWQPPQLAHDAPIAPRFHLYACRQFTAADPS